MNPQSANVELTPTLLELLEDLLVTALEGGSNYWYMFRLGPKKTARLERIMVENDRSLAQAIWTFLSSDNEALINVYDVETGEHLGSFTKQRAIDALGKLATDYPQLHEQMTGEEVIYDAGDADIWFQLAVLGEVIYG